MNTIPTKNSGTALYTLYVKTNAESVFDPLLQATKDPKSIPKTALIINAEPRSKSVHGSVSPMTSITGFCLKNE
ncbi:unnamed protein product [marine sediment metagenome]|uniref:Uncharacterized protein n=1 Tax=marine sediment metagenome TaxID=412755 RepID=X1G6B2_9ZZZZ